MVLKPLEVVSSPLGLLRSYLERGVWRKPTSGELLMYLPVRNQVLSKLKVRLKIFLGICPFCGGRLFRWSYSRLDCRDCSEKIYNMDFDEILRRAVKPNQQKGQSGYSGKQTLISILKGAVKKRQSKSPKARS